MVTTRQDVGEIYYPEEDGKVSESAKHYMQALYLIEGLNLYFAGRADVFVGGNLFVYYREGDPTKCFSPDVLVAHGVRPRPLKERGSYKLWQEGVMPQVIIELTSASTRQVDTMRKPRLYATLGVREYFLFDPLSEFLRPRLQGYRLNVAGQYERLVGEELDSEVLSLRLVIREDWLRLLNPAIGQLLPTPEEQATALAEQATALAEQATALATIEAENERLRAEIARLRGNQ